MARFSIRALPWLAAVLFVLTAPSPARCAVNSLTSVLSTNWTPGYYQCGYQGTISFSDTSSVARKVTLYVDGVADGDAIYLQKQGSAAPGGGVGPLYIPNIWDYHGDSSRRYAMGSQHSVYTIATVWNPAGGESTVASNTRSWTSGN